MLHIVWDPKLGIEIGSFVLRYYSLMFVLSFSLGFFIMNYIFKKEKIELKHLDPLFMHMFIGVLLGARLGHVLFYQPELFKEDFFSVFLPFQFNPEFRFTGFQGLASHGAIFGIIISLFIFVKKTEFNKSLFWLLDRIIIVTALGCSLVRIGNFMNSEIVGKAFDGSWAVLFVQQSKDYGAIIPRHPSQLYESIGYFLVFVLLIVLFFKTSLKEKTGKLFSIGLTSLLVIRLLIEFTKEPQGEEMISAFGLNSGQILSIPPIVFCLYLFFKNKTQKELS
jgi:phosphatidylglycerol---prolipoprotein diacylglyceryl transferase